MTVRGLLLVLAFAGVCGAILALWPALDIRVAGLFFDPAGGFLLIWSPTLQFLRDAAMWIVAAMAAPAAMALGLRLLAPRRRPMMSTRSALFLLTTLALGPGLIANVVLKDNWGRARPFYLSEFGGKDRFTPWWDPRGACDKNCSFVAGEASGAFWTLAPASLAPPPWRALAYGAALGFGAAVGLLRMALAGHFLSDVIFAGAIMFVLIWLMHGLFFRWRSAGRLAALLEQATPATDGLAPSASPPAPPGAR